MTGDDDQTGPFPGGDNALAAEYVLGLLGREEQREVEMRLAQDPALRDAVVFWSENFAMLTDSLPETSPPPRVLQAIEQSVFGPPRPPIWRQILPYLVGGIVAASVAWVAFVSGVLDPSPAPELRAELTPTDGVLTVRASFDTDTDLLAVVRLDGDVPPDRVHELWLIAGEDAPVSLGLLDADGDTVLSVSADLAERLSGATLAISEEPPGGSTTGAPTGPVRATGVVEAL